MLQVVRKYTQGWVATIMGLIMSFAFVLWGVENYLSGHSKKQVAAKVNGQEITADQIDSDLQRIIMRLKEQVNSNFSLPPIMQQQLREQALSNIIMETVLVQSAQKAGFTVTPQETSGMIKQMPAFIEDGVFSKERFQNIISKMGYTQQKFISDVTNTLLLNQVASGLIGSDFVMPNELAQAISLLEQKRDIKYILIPNDNFKKSIVITDDQVKLYYLQHKDLFKTPARVQVESVELSTDSLRSQVSVSEQELKEYLDANSNVDRSNPKIMAKAKDTIQQQKVEQAFLTTSDKLTDLAYTNPNSLTDVASALGLKVNTSDYFSHDGGNTPFTKNEKVIAAAFNSDTLKDHSNSNLIELKPGTVAIIRVKDYQPEGVAPISDVKEKIKRQLVDEKAMQEAKAKGTALLQNIKDKSDFAKIAKNEKLVVINKQNISRHEKGINPDILRLAFSIPEQSKVSASGTQLANGDSVLVLVENSSDYPTDKITDEQRTTMNKLYSDTYGKISYGLYIDNQISHAKVKNYQSK